MSSHLPRSRLAFVFCLMLSAAIAVGYAPSALGADWVVAKRVAEDRIKQRFPGVDQVGCAPDRTSYRSDGKWQQWLCTGRSNSAERFALTYRQQGSCGECWAIVASSGVRLSALKSPSPPSPRSDWYWSDSLATDTLSHSVWLLRRPGYDPDSVDCSGIGRSINGDNGVLLYQEFNCLIRNSYVPDIVRPSLYRLTVTGKSAFVMTKLQ